MPEENTPAEEKPKKTYRIRILSRDEFVTYPKLRQPVTMLAITYQVNDDIPRTVWIPKDEWTPEKEREIILKDYEKHVATSTEEFEVTV